MHQRWAAKESKVTIGIAIAENDITFVNVQGDNADNVS